MNALVRAFYATGAEIVAPALLGKVLVHRVRGTILRARIVETEAYVGSHDLACHASRGLTQRTKIMFGPPGHAYVYLIYGIYDMLNVVCAAEGDAQAVLIRAAEPLDGRKVDLSGPGKLARGLRITRALNGADLVDGRLYIVDEGLPSRPFERTPRIGVNYAGEWASAPLRFLEKPALTITTDHDPATPLPRRGIKPTAKQASMRIQNPQKA